LAQPGFPQRSVFPLGLTLLLLTAYAGAAPPPHSPPVSNDSSEISVTVVEIPVEVTQGGEPVRGLQAGDFEVLENGRPLPIVSAETIDLKDEGPGAAKVTQQAPAPPPPPAARRHLFLLFDFALSRPDRQVEGIAAARRMVASALDPSDLVSVGIYLPKGELPLLVPFTADRAAVDRTLGALADVLTGKHRAAGGADDPLRILGEGARTLSVQGRQSREVNNAAELLADFGERAAEGLGDAAEVEQNDIETRRRDHVMAMTESLAALGEYLRPIEGRKYLNLFSEGFSSALAYRPTQSPTDANLGGAALLIKLEDTLGALRRQGWVINAANLASSRGGGLNGDGLFILADKTGGVVVEGGNDLAQGLGQALRRSAHSYLLTVQVDVPPDGSYHPLEVRLRKPERGTRLVHRGGYFAPKPATATQQKKSAEHLAGAARLASEGGERNDLGVRALAVPLRTAGGPVRTAVLVEVPGDQLLASLPSNTARLGLEVFGYALDDRGEPKDFFAQAVQLDPAKVGDRLRQGSVRVLGKLDFEPGRQRLRVLVRERVGPDAADRLAVLTLPAGPAGPGPHFDVLFLAPPGDPWLLVKTQEAAFDLRGQEILPAAQPTLATGGEARVILLGSSLSGTGEWIRGRILTNEGKATEGGSFDVLSQTPGEGGEPDLLTGLLRTGPLPPGDYFLELRLGKDNGTVQATSVRSFRIE
jgi:VWFA-related protein